MEQPGRASTLRHTALTSLLVMALAWLAGCTPAAPAAKPSAAAPSAPASAPAAGGAPAAAAQPAAAAPAAAPAPAGLAAIAPLNPPQPVTFGTSPAASSAGAFIGVERGYFRELGLEVEIIPFNSAADMFQPIAASQLDVATADTGAGIFNALGRGLPLRFVADSNHTEPGHSGTAWVVKKELIESGAVRELGDLRGKRISGIARASTIDSNVQRTLAMAGLSANDVDLEYVTFPDVLPAMANNALDAAILIEPLVTASVEQGIGVRWKPLDELFGRNHGTFIMYSPNVVTQRQEVGRRFMLGFLRGVRVYLDAFDTGKDLDEVIAILTKYTNIKDPALYRKIVVPRMDPNGEMIVGTVKELQQWFVDNGLVTTPVNIEEYFDTSYADYAVSVLGRR